MLCFIQVNLTPDEEQNNKKSTFLKIENSSHLISG